MTPSTDFDRFFNVFLLRLYLGFLLVALGLGFLFQPKLIIRMNAFMRENVFKDTHVLLNNRPIGAVMFVIGFLLFILNFGVYR